MSTSASASQLDASRTTSTGVSGEFDPDLEVVIRIAEAVGVKLSELFAEPTYN